MNTLFKVVSQSAPVTINTKNGEMQKTTLVLQEIGSQYADSYVASLIGKQPELHKDDIVWASIRFQAREYNGSNYQDLTITGIVTLPQPF